MAESGPNPWPGEYLGDRMAGKSNALWALPYPRRRLETNLRSFIAARGLRQCDVARQVGVTRARLFRLIWGQAQPTRRERRKIAEVLCFSDRWIFEPNLDSPSWRLFAGSKS